jgi:hypothetical protein
MVLTSQALTSHATKGAEMKTQRVVRFMLVTALVAGCVTHRPPVAADRGAPAADDEAGAIVTNFWYVPGRALVCGGAGIMAGLILTFTWGQSYEEASQIMHGGCSGPWIVRASDIRGAVP